MRKLVASTVIVGNILFLVTVVLVAAGVLKTLRSEGNGLGSVSGADLLNMGTLAQLRLSLVSSGGKVLRLLPDGNGALVFTRQGHVQKILFAPDAVFHFRGTTVTRAAIEPLAHLTVFGFRSANGFAALKVYISPHHHAIGGRIEARSGRIEPGRDMLVTIIDRHDNTQVVRLLPGTPITFNKRPVRGPLRADTHVVVLAVPDPREPGIFLADTVKVVPLPQPIRVGGLIRSISPARNAITIYNKAQNLINTIEVIPGTTKITLSKWNAWYADMAAGDHVTVTGVTDPASASQGPNPIKAKRIRISSPSFGGMLIGIRVAPGGGVTLAVRAHHGHVLQIDAPGRTPVLYGTQPAHVLDLVIGEKIAVKGTRVGKFEEVATSIKVYPRSHTVGGMVASVLPGAYRIINSIDSRAIIVEIKSNTVFTLNGKPATAAAVKVGLHVRVSGYDALRSEQKNIPTLIARHVSVFVHQRHPRKSTHHAKSKTHHAAVTPAPTPTPSPTPRVA